MSSTTAFIPNKSSNVRDIDFTDPAFLAAPWLELARLQREAPAYWSEKQGGWILTRHADVKAAYADRRLSAARVGQLFRGIEPELAQQLEAVRKYTGLLVNRLDGEQHVRIRALLLKAFDRGSVKKLESFIDDVIDTLLDQCADAGAFDFQKRVSAVLPTTVMQRLFDLPDEYLSLLFDLASSFVASSAAAKVTPELLLQLERTIRSMNEVFSELIKKREANPGDDLISTLVHARDGLQRLSHDELLAQLHGLVVAGAETTSNSLGTQLVHILRNPDLIDRLRTDPECSFALVTELLRYPGTVKCMTRYAKEDIEIGGASIRQGDLLWIMNGGANVDPSVFPDPLSTDIDRPNLRESMAFGPGLHHCVGHMLARAELSAFFKRAFQRFDIEILQDSFEMVPSYIFFGYRSLQVRFSPRPTPN